MIAVLKIVTKHCEYIVWGCIVFMYDKRDGT